jgi:hypothetical protein
VSFPAYQWVKNYSESRRSARLVLIAIADHCDDAGRNSWPSISTLARETRLCKTAVYAGIAELIALGELEVSDDKSTRRTNVYSLPKMVRAAHHPDKQMVRPAHSDGARGGPLMVRAAHSDGTRGAPELIHDLNQEPNRELNHEPVLPDWLPLEPWRGFVESRKKLRAPLTKRATLLILNELEKLRTHGYDPAAVLDQSVRNGWKDVFPIKNGGNHANNKAEQRRDDNMRARDEARAAIVAGR